MPVAMSAAYREHRCDGNDVKKVNLSLNLRSRSFRSVSTLSDELLTHNGHDAFEQNVMLVIIYIAHGSAG